MVFAPDDVNLPDLGSISPNLGKLSTDDGVSHQLVFERLEFSANDRVDLSFSQQKIRPITEEKAILKSEIERTTTDDVIQISTSQVKLTEEFNRTIIIND
jgi:hypothetical protein